MRDERVTTAQPATSGRLRLWAAGLSLAAGLVHGAAAADHTAEWWGYGAFFFTAAVAQGLYGLLLLLRPWHYDETGGHRAAGDPIALRDDRLAYRLGVAGNLAIIGLYVVTRTLGIPWFGPDAGEVEPVTPLGLLSKALELALVGCLLVLLRASAGPASEPEPERTRA